LVRVVLRSVGRTIPVTRWRDAAPLVPEHAAWALARLESRLSRVGEEG